MNAVRLTHIGGPTVLVELDGWRILTDPTFDEPGRTYRFGLGTSSRKVTGPAIRADDLGPIDAVLLTHDHHADNLDDAGRALLSTAPVVVTTTSGARRLGNGAVGLDAWGVTRLEADGRAPLEVTATPCRHGPPLSKPLVGDVVGFALRTMERAVEGAADGERDGMRDVPLWISGDTVLYDGVREVAQRLRVEVAVVHLGGVRFPVSGPLRYTMTARDAIELLGSVRPRVAVPVHYEGWSHFVEGREAIERELATAPADVRQMFQWLPFGVATEVGS